MIACSSLTGLVLAGGQGRRIQAVAPEKGLLELDGLPLVEHACRHLAPYVDKVLISANTNLDVYAQYGDVISDDPALGAYSGPLAGIASALRRISTPWLAVLPVDVPHPPVDLLDRLCESVDDEGACIAYASTLEGVHPLCMVVHCGLADDLYDFLLSGERKVQFWQRRNGAVPVLFDDMGDMFFNINTPEDLLRVRGLLE